MTRIEQIEQAAKTQRAVSLERAFVAGAIWADQSRDIDKIEANAFHRGQKQMKDRLETEVRNFTLRRWGVGEHDVNEMIRYIFGRKNCADCVMAEYPPCNKGIPCCKCGDECNSRQPCPKKGGEQ